MCCFKNIIHYLFRVENKNMKKLIYITIVLSAAFVTPLFSVTSHAETLNTKVEYNNIANEKCGLPSVYSR